MNSSYAQQPGEFWLIHGVLYKPTFPYEYLVDLKAWRATLRLDRCKPTCPKEARE